MDQSKGTPGVPMKLTKDQVYRYGMEIRRMMKTEAFEAAVELTRATYQMKFFDTSYGDTSAREQAYRQNVALNDLLDSLNAFVVNAKSQDEQDDDIE